jgi:NTP pyrophosphatase (non-canonical NTP hydrolase)
MEFKEYQKLASTTMIYGDGNKVIYPTLGLCGEAGEVAEKVKKVLRDNNGEFTDEKKEEIKKELGDVIWYLAAISTDLGLDLNEVAQLNIDKLFSRKKRNKIHGDGDNR